MSLLRRQFYHLAERWKYADSIAMLYWGAKSSFLNHFRVIDIQLKKKKLIKAIMNYAQKNARKSKMLHTIHRAGKLYEVDTRLRMSLLNTTTNAYNSVLAWNPLIVPFYPSSSNLNFNHLSCLKSSGHILLYLQIRILHYSVVTIHFYDYLIHWPYLNAHDVTPYVLLYTDRCSINIWEMNIIYIKDYFPIHKVILLLFLLITTKMGGLIAFESSCVYAFLPMRQYLKGKKIYLFYFFIAYHFTLQTKITEDTQNGGNHTAAKKYVEEN